MKRSLLTMALGFSMMSFPTAQAANTVVLRGTVGTTCTVDFNPNGQNLNLPIVAGGSVLIGQIEETCNFPGGYTILAQSLNGSVLVNTTNPAATTTYTVTVQDGFAGVGIPTVPTPIRTVGPIPSPVNGLLKDMTVNVTAAGTPVSGDYEDTVTLTISTP